MKPSHLILLLIMNFFWAAVYSAYKVIGTEIPSGNIVTFRFGLAALCFLVLWPWLPGKTPKGKDFWVTCFMGVMLFVVGQRLQVYANQIGTAGNSAVLMAFEPLLTSVLAAIFLREHIGPRRLAGFILSILGIALLNRVWSPDFRWSGLTASLIFISSFTCESTFSVMGKPVVQRAGAMRMMAISLLVALAINLIIDGRSTLTVFHNLSPGSWVILFALAIITTVIAYTVWFVVIRDAPLNVVAMTVFAQSVFGVFIAALWVGEKIHWGHALGSLSIAIGLGIGLSRQIQPKEPQRGS